MSGTGQVLAAGTPLAESGGRPLWRGRWQSGELGWAAAFLAPYAAVFIAFVVVPAILGLWLARKPALYGELLADPAYREAFVNTLLFAGIGVNLKMFLALLLSGFFLKRSWWAKALLAAFLLPFALPSIPAFVSFHWMLIGEQGLIDSLLKAIFGIEGPLWFTNRGLALGADIVAYVWKWLPFWTLVFIAARLAIPREIHEAAAVDGASGARRFLHVTLPLLANLYLVCTLLSSLWTIGDFTTVFLVSGGAPALSTEVLATLGMHYAFDAAEPELGIAASVSALPLLIPLTLWLIRRIEMREVQL